MAFGGETVQTSLVIGHPLPFGGRGRTTLVSGFHAFRDDPALWQFAHPGDLPVNNRFRSLELQGQWALAEHWSIGASGSVLQEDSHRFVDGNRLRGWTAVASVTWHDAARVRSQD